MGHNGTVIIWKGTYGFVRPAGDSRSPAGDALWDRISPATK
jgi:hypothetical protein